MTKNRSWDDYDRDQLIEIIKIMEVRVETQAARNCNLEAELIRERQLWQVFVKKLETPNMFAHDSMKLYQWLEDLNHPIRKLLKVYGLKYGLAHLCYARDVDEDHLAVAVKWREIQDYMNWDDE